jgi:hypothetical protein
MAKAKDKVEGQRKAIREHIDKYNIYPIPHEKEFALKTIRNCQQVIANLRRRHPHLKPSWEDNWQP